MNGRKDFQIEMMEGVDIKLLSKSSMASSGVDYKTSPYNLRIQMSGSGLYHFRSRVPRYMSYCDLQTEFVVCSGSNSKWLEDELYWYSNHWPYRKQHILSKMFV